MNRIRISVIMFAFALLTIFGVSRVFADSIPTISIVCEQKSGNLIAFDDGFSLRKRCPPGSRMVTLISGIPASNGEKGDSGPQGPTGSTGLQGATGFTGPQGATGIQGEKGNQGEPGFIVEKEINVCFHVPTGVLRVMLGGSCGSDVQWKIPVRCVPGKPCQPDNPNDPFYQ